MTPNLNLVNEPDLIRILRSEIFIHSNGQLRVDHIILRYHPLSLSFQASTYIIKAKDPGFNRSISQLLGSWVVLLLKVFKWCNSLLNELPRKK